MKEGEAKSNDYAIIAIVILIATGLWFFEVLTRHFVFPENIPIALIPDDWNEIWTRLLIMLMIVGFSIYVRTVILKIRTNEEKLLKAKEASNIFVSRAKVAPLVNG